MLILELKFLNSANEGFQKLMEMCINVKNQNPAFISTLTMNFGMTVYYSVLVL